MPIIFHNLKGSPPCAGTLLAAKSLGVEINVKHIGFAAGEHLKPEFLKMNPQHTLPTIDDDGFYLWESRSIMTYFADKYSKNESLYPKDPTKRAVINQRLYFDMGTLYQRFGDYLYPQIFENPGKPADPEQLKKLHEAFGFLNTFLDGQTYVAGDSLSLADISLVATVATIEASRIDFDKYENVKKWFAHCKATLPGWEIIDDHAATFKTFIPAGLNP